MMNRILTFFIILFSVSLNSSYAADQTNRYLLKCKPNVQSVGDTDLFEWVFREVKIHGEVGSQWANHFYCMDLVSHEPNLRDLPCLISVADVNAVLSLTQDGAIDEYRGVVCGHVQGQRGKVTLENNGSSSTLKIKMPKHHPFGSMLDAKARKKYTCTTLDEVERVNNTGMPELPMSWKNCEYD